jgi:ABC-type bacteriocin/lantibiotic exporter with double-glycine peptidase domain
MRKRLSAEEGHINILGATLLAAMGVIVLAWGAVGANSTLVWIGAVVAAVMLLVQFFLVHAELGRLWARLNELEQKNK